MPEKLLELIAQVQDCGADVTDVVKMIWVENQTLADHLIANGVVIPVRCEECKHSREYVCKVDPMRNHRLCYKDDVTVRFVEDDFYCAYGERKDNG